MASKDDAPVGAANGNGNAAQPSLNVLAQYVKDLSFESPGAPNSLRAPCGAVYPPMTNSDSPRTFTLRHARDRSPGS